MIGNNSLQLNEATMIQALQFWLDSQFINKAPIVTAISCASGPSKVFCVSLESNDEARAS
mgnify:CR=1 FL=1